jgi:glutamine synthetase
VNASWGIENRSAAVRVISPSAQPDRCRIGCRRPGADANPYLVLAGLLVATADGLRAGAEPPPPVVGDAYARHDLPALPGSLESALAAFRADGKLRAGLGESFSDYFAVSREWELKAWRESVSDWERERYERAV